MSEALRLADELDALMDEESLVGAVTIDRAAAELRRLHALNAELVEALRGTVQEMISVVASLNAEQMPHDGDEFHERLEKARTALAKVEASK